MRPRRRSKPQAAPNGKITKPCKKRPEKKVERKSAFATYLKEAANAEDLTRIDHSNSTRMDDDCATLKLTQMEKQEEEKSAEEQQDQVIAGDENVDSSTENPATKHEEFTMPSIRNRYFDGIMHLQNPTEMILDKDESLPISSDNSPEVSDEDISCDKEQIMHESSNQISSDDETSDEVGIFALSGNRAHVLLGINHSAKIFGRGYMKVIKGRIEILGSVLTARNEKEAFYVPVTDFALVLQCCVSGSDIASDDNLPLSSLLSNDPAIEVPESAIENFVLSHSSVVLFSSLDASDLEIYPGYPDIFKLRRKNIIQELCYGAGLARTARCFECFPSYIKATDSILRCNDSVPTAEGILKNSSPMILTIGGKGTGKSTFNRYLVNKMLQLFPSIDYLDCDIGQPEFTLPGFISLTCVKSPLLGPPFTHMQDPSHAIYYGRINCAGQPDRYIQCLKKILTNRDRTIPLIVNTMGWIRGLGLNILIDIIRMVQPSHIIQISGVKESKNLPLVTRDFVENSEGWCSNTPSAISQFQTLLVETNLEIYEESGYNPSDLRNLRVLSYLCTVQKYCGLQDFGTSYKAKFSLSSLSVLKPYKVKLSDVALFACHDSGIRRDFSLSVFNASLVGLSVISRKQFKHCLKSRYLRNPPNCMCRGIGIVRGVDVEQKCFFIISHLSTEVLRNINCLTLGCLTIPESMHESSKLPGSDNSSAPPYVTKDFPFEVVGSGKFRVYRSK